MQNDLLCQNDKLFPTVGKGIPFIDSLNANGAKKIWTEEKTAILIGSPPPSDGNSNAGPKPLLGWFWSKWDNNFCQQKTCASIRIF